MKCYYTHCKHGGQVDKDDAVHVGNKCYHKDCYQEKENANAIARAFSSYVKESYAPSHIRKTINTIIVDQHVNSSYLLFALRYYISNHMPLHSPTGLFYVVKNKNVLRAWKCRSYEVPTVDITKIDDVAQIRYKPKSPKQFQDILQR